MKKKTSLPRSQGYKKKSVNEYTYDWEELSTQVQELTNDQQLQTYIHGLKQHIHDELELQHLKFDIFLNHP